MKKIISIIISLATVLTLSACGTKSDSPEQTSSQTASETSVQTTTEPESTVDGTYTAALKVLYKEVLDKSKDTAFETDIVAYMTDINNDGYNDVFYQYSWFPELAVYDNGKFVTCLGIDDFEVLGGSVFPSGDEGGYFIDPDKGIVVVRYDGHTLGSITYREAQAYKIEGTEAESLWIEKFECDEDDPRYNPETYGDDPFSAETWDALNKQVNEEYNKQYLPRIADYNLVSFYDVSDVWNDESV